MVPKACSRCGREVDGEAPQGLCPSCLLQQGLSEETEVRPETNCASCDSPLPAGARFCAHCGAAAPATVKSESDEDPLRHALEAKLSGQYRVLRLLGHGGMGAVYLARDLTLEREVAIKVVKPASDAQGMYDRFRREAKTAAKLSHPNIVPLHAFGEIDGMPYFVMGFVRGESLADRMRRDGKLPEEDARRILVEIAGALDHAHRLGVVHRDVKPDNVLLEDATGRALLTDFGIAKTMSHGETLTQHGSVVGTPHFMSPEQAAGRPDIDGRSDIYSLGIMGYAMLTGRLPFEGNSARDVLVKHMTQEPASLRSLVPTVSDSMLQSVERSMAKDPAKRWQDGRALVATLGTTEETGLPDELESVQGHGVPFLAIATGLLLALWIVFRNQHAPTMAILGLIAVTILAGYVVTVTKLRFEGFPIALTQRVIWSEPSWWRSWYPRPLRRASNVWDRLPRSVRRFRLFVPLVFISLAIAAIGSVEYIFIKVAFFLVVLAMAIVLEFATKRDMKRMGIVTGNDLNRILFSSPPSRATFWNQPRIAIILAPPVRREAPSRADSPHDQLRSILRVADELSGPLRPLGVEASAAARGLLASIEQADKQIADLARSLEPGEEQRLVEKIEALATVEESAPMRALIEKQLELIRGLTTRIEELKENRRRHAEVLKTLALHVVSLRARLAETPSEVSSLSDKVRALCENISRQGINVPREDAPTVEQRNA